MLLLKKLQLPLLHFRYDSYSGFSEQNGKVTEVATE